MRKTILVSILAIMTCGVANAGLLESLGITQKSEPQTLAEACDTDEIKKVCPEILLGTKTVTECLKDNVTALSQQCATFIKKSITSGGDDIKAKIADAASGVSAESDAASDAAASRAAEVKEAATETLESAKRTGGLLKSLF